MFSLLLARTPLLYRNPLVVPLIGSSQALACIPLGPGLSLPHREASAQRCFFLSSEGTGGSPRPHGLRRVTASLPEGPIAAAAVPAAGGGSACGLRLPPPPPLGAPLRDRSPARE